MKKIFIFLAFTFLFLSCQETIEKPDKLIEKPVMVDIIYDLSLLEAIKTNNNLLMQNLNVEAFIYKKYKIDSLQLVQNSRYYASDVANYKKMYEEVAKRIEENKTQNKFSKRTKGNIKLK